MQITFKITVKAAAVLKWITVMSIEARIIVGYMATGPAVNL